MTIQFLKFHFGERTMLSDPVIRLLDDFSGHWTRKVIAYAKTNNVILEKVPPGLTWMCQLADVVWMKLMKDRLRRFWVAFLQKQRVAYSVEHESDDDDDPHLVRYKMKAPDRGTIV